jgi:hypothetical protein
MSPDLRATQLYVGNVTTVNPVKTTLYTVAAGKRVILKSVQARNLYTGGTNTFYLFVATYLVWSYVLAAGGSAGSNFELRPWIVINPGQTLQAAVTNATGAGLVVSGSLHYI